MAKNKLTKSEQQIFNKIGKKIRSIILADLGYKSLDSFALEYHDIITKPSLYAICDGRRDFQFSTLIRLSKALGVDINNILSESGLNS